MVTIRRGIGICGIGAVTGYGWGREALWTGLRSMMPAAVPISGYGEAVGPSGVGAAGPGAGEAARSDTRRCDIGAGRVGVREHTRAGPAGDGTGGRGWVARIPEGGDPGDGRGLFARAMRAAAREAVRDARQRGWRPGPRVGLLHAVVLGEVALWRDFYLFDGGDLRARDYLALMPSTPMSALMREHGFHGPAMNVSAMCASGNAGLLTAKLWVDAGVVDDVLLVVTDLSLTPENVRHFVRLGVAVVDSEPLQGCRPFQTGSRGFVMGEASVAFVLSATGPRGGPPRPVARPYAVVLGGAMSHDAHHVTSIDPALTRVRGCFADALADAGVRPAEVGYVNAHGPGTRQCDTAEATILDEMFGEDTGIYSVKPLTGHCQGAASAVEVAVAALGYERGLVPAPPVVGEPHPRLLHGECAVDGRPTVKSSLGMGGHNAVVVLAPAP